MYANQRIKLQMVSRDSHYTCETIFYFQNILEQIEAMHKGDWNQDRNGMVNKIFSVFNDIKISFNEYSDI